MTSFPDSIYSPRAKENRNGVVYDATKKSVIFKEDISKLDDEIVAIETDLTTLSKMRAELGTANQTIANSSWTRVAFNNEKYDTRDEYDAVTSHIFTAKTAGYYHVDAQVIWNAGAGIYRTVYVRKNNVTFSLSLFSAAPGAIVFPQSCSSDVYLAVGDFIDVQVFHIAGGNLDILYGLGTFLSIHKLPGG